MNNVLWGSITVLLCLIGYYYSWKYYKSDKTVNAVFLLVFCGFLLRLFVSFDLYIHPWDEMLHALVAKNFLKHPLLPTLYDNPILPVDYKNWLGNHIWVHKQPFPIWGIAASLYVFGIHEISVRIPSILLTTTGIAITYYTASHFFNKKVGYLSAFLYSINGLIIEMTSGRIPTDHVDVFFLFFIQLGVFFAIKYSEKFNITYNILCGISIGIAILCKWMPALIVLPIWFLILIHTKKLNNKQIFYNFIVLMFFVCLTFMPWQIYTWTYFPAEAQYSQYLNFKHITDVLDNQGGPFYYFFDGLRIHYGELIYIPFIWFFWKMFRHRKNKRYLAVAVWFLVPYIFFSFVATKMKGFTLFASPAIFMIYALFFHYLFRYRKRFRYRWIINTFLVLTIVFAIRYSLERVKPYFNLERNPKWTLDIKDLKQQGYGSRTVLFNTPHPLETMFHTDITAYRITPDISTINRLASEGYTILINNKEELLPEYRNLERVKYINLSND